MSTLNPTLHPPSPHPHPSRKSLSPSPWQRLDRAPRLTFGSLAWLKLMFFLHAGETEVGGFGMAAADDPLYVQDFVTVKQKATCVTVAFADEAVADYFDACIDAGLPPARFARIWCHTHPGQSPEPSRTDEETFARVFGACDWSVMFIVSRAGRTYARLAFAAGPGGAMLIPVRVDWEDWPSQVADEAAGLPHRLLDWIGEYQRNVQAEVHHGMIEINAWDAEGDPEDPYGLGPFLQQVMDEPPMRPQVLHEFVQGHSEPRTEVSP
jgi:hypothetical protein